MAQKKGVTCGHPDILAPPHLFSGEDGLSAWSLKQFVESCQCGLTTVSSQEVASCDCNTDELFSEYFKKVMTGRDNACTMYIEAHLPSGLELRNVFPKNDKETRNRHREIFRKARHQFKDIYRRVESASPDEQQQTLVKSATRMASECDEKIFLLGLTSCLWLVELRRDQVCFV